MFCPEVNEIIPGDLFIDAMLALPDGVHSQVIKYQKHLVRASLPPVEFSFFSKSCAIVVAFCRR